MTEAHELYELLRFFSLPQAEQWARVPAKIPASWVSVGAVETIAEDPVRVLALVLSDHLNGCGQFFDGDPPEVLDEIRVLLYWYMLESNHDLIFIKREAPDGLDLIWLTLARLCSIALSDEAVARHRSDELSFDHFLRKYTHPLNGQTGEDEGT